MDDLMHDHICTFYSPTDTCKICGGKPMPGSEKMYEDEKSIEPNTYDTLAQLGTGTRKGFSHDFSYVPIVHGSVKLSAHGINMREHKLPVIEDIMIDYIRGHMLVLFKGSPKKRDRIQVSYRYDNGR
jgi:hypothetical protein